MDFVAIDVETANPDMASICQIGAVRYQDGQVCEEWSSLIDPEDDFDSMNVSIHGITARDVRGAPRFSQACDHLMPLLRDRVVVSHTHFDRVALTRAASRYRMDLPTMVWLDSARVARRAWEEVALKGYGLYALCERIGYRFKHHDALEDARAAAHVLMAASMHAGLDIEGWISRVRQPINPAAGSPQRDGNPDGALYGETVVFTGALAIPRSEAADLAASLGCNVASNVTKSVSLLVVGDQDIRKLVGQDKSAKHRKAEEMIAAGAAIRILMESDFRELVRIAESRT